MELYIQYLPLVSTNAIFNMGTLILTILVHRLYSLVYISCVFLANVAVGIILPFGIIESIEAKYGEIPRCQLDDGLTSKEDDRKRIKATKIARSVYMGCAHLFMSTRPVEKLTF